MIELSPAITIFYTLRLWKTRMWRSLLIKIRVCVEPASSLPTQEQSTINPPFLSPGMGITAPSRPPFQTPGDIQNALKRH